MELSQAELASIKKSFLNIVALFFKDDEVKSKYVACLIKWSVQLQLSTNDLHNIESNFNVLPFKPITGKVQKMEAIYHLVHMIYLDNVVEDVELEVASLYAQQLGFEPSIVGELFKSIATAPYDTATSGEVRESVKDFLKLQEL